MANMGFLGIVGSLIIVVAMTTVNADYEDLHLTILHTTDVSSRFEHFDTGGKNCTEEQDMLGMCFGGVPRRGTIIKKVRQERENDINVLLLDAGDQFVGTWYNFFRGKATSYFMNQLGYDAMVSVGKSFVCHSCVHTFTMQL